MAMLGRQRCGEAEWREASQEVTAETCGGPGLGCVGLEKGAGRKGWIRRNISCISKEGSVWIRLITGRDESLSFGRRACFQVMVCSKPLASETLRAAGN